MPHADWHRGRQVDLLRQIADEEGGLLPNDSEPSINPKAWPARVERVYASLAFDAWRSPKPALECRHSHPEFYGAGLLRIMLAERSFKNRPHEPNQVERCEVRTSRRRKGLALAGTAAKRKDIKVPGPLAVRAGLSPWSIYTTNEKRRLEKLLTVDKSRHPRSKSQKSNKYAFSDDLISEVQKHVHSGKFKLAAEIPVSTFILQKFQLKKGYAEFSREDLTTCGLVSLAWADAGLKRLLSCYDDDGVCVKRGLFIAIGFGRVTLPELVDKGYFRAVDALKIWDAPAAQRGASENLIQAVREPNPAMGPEAQPGASESPTQAMREPNPGSFPKPNPAVAREPNPAFVPETQPVYEHHEVLLEQHEGCERHEGLYEQLQGFELLEDHNSALSSPSFSTPLDQESEQHMPDYGSGTPSPSSDAEGLGSFIAALIETVGPTSPTKPGKHRDAISQCAAAIRRRLAEVGRDEAWALAEVRRRSDWLAAKGWHFDGWGPKRHAAFHGVRGVIDDAILRESKKR